MASGQESREELDRMAREGETVVPGGTGGKSLEAQEHLAEGTSSIVTKQHAHLSSSLVRRSKYRTLTKELMN